MDHHTVATVSIAGSGLDVLGSLYLAYDLLGGQAGPLRLLTRAVTYSVVFGIGYGLGLGFFFGLAAGAATGVTIAIELTRMARMQDHYSLFWESVFSAIRGLAFGAGSVRASILARGAAPACRGGNSGRPSSERSATSPRHSFAVCSYSTWNIRGFLRCEWGW